MERYELGPAEFVEYLMSHKYLFPHGAPDWFYIQHRIVDESGIGYEYQPMSRKVEGLDDLAFHYRTIRNHERKMQDNGYYDRYYDEWTNKDTQKGNNEDGSPSRLAKLESQLAEAQKQMESLRQWNKRLNEQNQELRGELAAVQEIRPSVAEVTTTVDAAKWENSVKAVLEIWAEIVQGDKTDGKEDECRAALAQRYRNYHTKHMTLPGGRFLTHSSMVGAARRKTSQNPNSLINHDLSIFDGCRPALPLKTNPVRHQFSPFQKTRTPTVSRCSGVSVFFNVTTIWGFT